MSNHRRLQILIAAHAALMGSTSAGAGCFIGNLKRITEDVSINVMHGRDEPREGADANATTMDSDAEIFIDLSVRGRSDAADGSTVPRWLQALSDLAAEVHRELLAAPDLGLPWLFDLEPDGTEAPRTDGDGERIRVTLRTRWRAIYRHAYADPSTGV